MTRRELWLARLVASGAMTAVEAQRHLPGHHSQKTHGQGGGAGGPRINRGIVANATDVPIDRADRIAAGTATEEDIASIVDMDNPGAYWYSENEGFGVQDAMEFAEGEETLDGYLSVAKEFGETEVSFELPVVMSGHAPVGWSSSNNPDDGMMGNSYIPSGDTISIDTIRYSPGEGKWHEIQVNREATMRSAAPVEMRRKKSKVERSVNKIGDNCPQCQANDDPAKVPVHPHCNCEVVTDDVELGLAVEDIDEFASAIRRDGGDLVMVGSAEFPEGTGLIIDGNRGASLDKLSFRFGDLAKWFVQQQDLSSRDMVTIVGGEDVVDMLIGQLTDDLDVVQIARSMFQVSTRSAEQKPFRVFMMPGTGSIEDLAQIYRALMEEGSVSNETE